MALADFHSLVFRPYQRKMGEIYRVPDEAEYHAVKFPQFYSGTDLVPVRNFHEKRGRYVLLLTNSLSNDDQRDVVRVVPLSHDSDEFKYVIQIPNTAFKERSIKGDSYAALRICQGMCIGWLRQKIGFLDTEGDCFIRVQMGLLDLYKLDEFIPKSRFGFEDE
ncbi:hypothetical protein HQ531_03410 [bacterium]|nr:hypothetical protein [bacterium]